MTAKLSGTDGLLQSYDYQTPATGFSYTFAAGTQMLFMVPATALASGTITMPPTPSDGMVITFSSSQQITALTLQGNSSQSISGAVTFLPAQTAASYVYRLTIATWYPCETVPGTGSQLVLGTSQSATSGTAINFTGIPSWAKRITIMFNDISNSGVGYYLVQTGSGSIQTTGYNSGSFYSNTSNQAGGASSTTGFVLFSNSAAGTLSGHMVLASFGSNIWIASHSAKTSTTLGCFGGGDVTLSGAPDRVRIYTNSNGLLDSGSINILYE